MSTAQPIPYRMPATEGLPHSRIGVIAFVLCAYAAGAMLLSLLAVSFPLVNAPASWEYPAAVFAFTMLGGWVLGFILTVVGLLQRNTNRTLPRWAFLMDLAALFFAALFIGVA